MLRETHVNALILLALLAVPLGALVLDQPFIITLATKVTILALAGVGLNLALGQGGLVSFGHAIFFGLGGYSMGILASHAQSFTPLMEVPFVIPGTNLMPVIWIVAIAVSCLAALVVGALSLRTSGVYFIMVTLAFGQMFYYFAISWPAYGGEDGLSIYVRNQFPGLNTLVPIQFFGLCFAVLCAVLFLVSRLNKSAFGLALTGAHYSPVRAMSVGIEVTRLRLVAFVISGGITGLAGALFADLNRFVSPTMFSWHTSGEIIIFIILGGVARLCGPIAGAAAYIILEQYLGGFSEYWQIYLGLILLFVVLFAQGGLIGSLSKREIVRG
ncbi:MAG: branched-chain amino acid ABC transporter permease [Pseudomonadota bacterium]